MKKITFRKVALGGAPGAILGYIILFFFAPKNQETSLLIQVSLIAFFVKESISFCIYKRWWTFEKSRLREIAKEVLLYFPVLLFLALINTFLLYALVEKWGLNSVLSQAILNSFSMLVGYINTKEVFESDKKLGDT